MPNPNPKQQNLRKFKPKWNSGKTKAIRIPEAFADRLIEIARLLDESEPITCTLDRNQVKVHSSSYSNSAFTCTSDNNNDKQSKLMLSKTEAIEEVDRLLSHKKSKKDTLFKLIKVIYKD